MLTIPEHNYGFNGGNKKHTAVFNPKSFYRFENGWRLQLKKCLHRLSPFLIVALLLPFASIASYVYGIQLFSSLLLQTLFIILLESYLLFIDFMLWNYFEGKLRLRIWLIEFVLESLAVAIFL